VLAFKEVRAFFFRPTKSKLFYILMTALVTFFLKVTIRALLA